MISSKLVISGLQIYTDAGVLQNDSLVIEGETIKRIGHPFAEVGAQEHTFPSTYHLIPGRIDLHIHGAGGVDVMDSTPEALQTLCLRLPEEGVTSFLATTMTAENKRIEQALSNVGKYIKEKKGNGAEILGVHLEGPFLSLKQAGAHPHAYIQPVDHLLFKRWQALSEDTIRLVTLAPEMDGTLSFIGYLRENGVVASLGHSHATYEQAIAGIEAGATHVTHLFNAMRGLHHRDPGVVGAALLHEGVKAELIADGLHVRWEVINMALRIKGQHGFILVTDAIRAKCMGDGIYDLGGQEVHVTDGKAALKDGTLAGSVLKMDEAARKMMEHSSCTLADTILMSSVNPAKQLGLYHRKGSITVGKDADLVVLDEEYRVVMTLCKGRVVFRGP